jgi:CheY-like chemotaxis protein
VTQSGGYIRLQSEEGKGTTFRIYFPRVEAETVETEAAAAPIVIPRGNEVILVVEDSEEVRELTCRTLAMQGYRVLEAANGAEAIAVARRCPQPIGLLLTDVVMPGMSGRSLADALTAEMPGLAVAYTSGYTEDAIVRHGVLEPGIRFLPKPFLPSELAIFVRDVLGPADEPAGNETA